MVSFDELSREALASRDVATAEAALEHYQGELLPDDLYEEWAAERRELLRLRHVNLLRRAGRWQEVSEIEPDDEHARLELLRYHVAHGDSGAALREYDRLAHVLDRDARPRPVGTSPCRGIVEDLIAELSELTRRQATLLRTLAAAGLSEPHVAVAGP